MCHCSSHKLYSEEIEKSFFKCKTSSGSFTDLLCKRSPVSSFNCLESQFMKIFLQNIDLSSIRYPSEIDIIDYQDILENPLFFYKAYLAKNVPCVIKNAINDWKALENWENPEYLGEILGQEGKNLFKI